MAPENLKIIGTAHVSEKSVEEVKNVILETHPDTVAVELDSSRYQNLLDQRNGVEEKKEIKIREMLKGDQLTLFIVSGFLTYLQNKIGDEVGVKPGAEMMAAVEAAEESGAKIQLIDRDIRITLKRALNQMSFWEKAKFIYSIIASFFSTDEAIEDIETIKEGDALEEVMEYFKEMSPRAYEVLVKERDAYMAQMLLNSEGDVVAVVGAGHREGIQKYMETPESIPPLHQLLDVKESKVSPGKIILFAIPVLFIIIFLVAFFKGVNIQTGLLQFTLLTGGLACLGSLLAGSKIPSAITAFVVAPITAIHPLLAAGWFAGLVEAKIRGFTMEDLSNLTKSESFRELWDNNIFRILLVATGANLGCMIGLFLSIFNVLMPLTNTIMGF